ncbi:C4-dicarboxylate ABC transporter substrate-binding protein [Thalassospira profundimaris]|uniref:C4-dicarboxylate ABC transporter substrate-binding protein n=1 Tax=Thalassospira profundimaris TaxID=502049 RepID=A0A367WUV2_9PROT|nr:TRAP transporter substrate-binding protein DctP [Thalassospira profundimaris]RCK45246.1 C4-dicarboxylate ABC transporter substrate-binding protein [Thalassospira profundimaris]
MKKIAMIAALMATLGVGSTAQAADVTLRIASQLPPKSHIVQNLDLFKKEVEEKSNGSIAVEIYDSATLYKDKEIPSAVGSGSIEMGSASLTRYAGDVPAVDVFYQPFLIDSEEKVRAAVAPGSPVRGPLDKAIADTGSTVLWWQAYGGTIMLSKGAPIHTPKDLEGKKVRVFGKSLGQFVEAAGGAPTLISGSEQYLAYQRGTVDVGMTGISGVKSRKLWEVMDTVTVTNLADVEFIVMINTDFWNSLTDDQRAIITAASRDAEKDVRDRMSAIEAEAFKEAEENGMTIYTPTEEELKQWRAVSQPVYDSFLKESGDLGKQVFDAAKKL